MNGFEFNLGLRSGFCFLVEAESVLRGPRLHRLSAVIRTFIEGKGQSICPMTVTDNYGRPSTATKLFLCREGREIVGSSDAMPLTRRVQRFDV